MSDGKESTTPPVYLRLQKRAEKYSRHSGGRRPFPYWPAVRFASAMLALGMALWMTSRFLETDPRFRLRSVELQGGRHILLSDVEGVFHSDQYRSLYRIPLEERRRSIESIAWIRTASVTRLLPDRLWITVEERVPVAFVWVRRGISLIDAEGVLLEIPPQSSFSLPVVRGLSEEDSLEQRRSKMRRFTALLDELRGDDGPGEEQISEVDLADPENTRIVVTHPFGAIRLHLGGEQFLARYGIFSSHIQQWRQQFGEIDSIDLRYEGQAVIHAGARRTLPVEKMAYTGSGQQNTAPPAANAQ